MGQHNFDTEFKIRFSTNILSNVVYFILNIVIGLALVPFFLDTLGESAYALVPLATSLTSYIVLIIDAVNTSVMRYLTLDLQREDFSEANHTFNSALFGTLLVCLILLPIIGLAAGMAPTLFNTGGQTFVDVFILFSLVILASVIRFSGNAFMVVLFAYNRLDLRNYVSIVYIGLQVLLIVLLFTLFTPSLPLIGISYLIAAIIAVGISILFSRRVCPQLHISRTAVSKTRLKELMQTSGWAVVNQFGAVLRLQISIIVVNILCGSVAETEFSLAFTWFSLLTSLSGVLLNTFTPQLYAYCAKNNTAGLVKFSKALVRVSGVLLVLPVGLVCIFTPQLLTLWVGEQYVFLTPLVWMIIIPLVIRTPGNAIYPLVIAYNRIRVAALVSISVGVLNLLLSIAIPLIMNNGYYGVAYAWIISTVLEAIVCLVYMAYILHYPLSTFVTASVPSIYCFVILLLMGFGITQLFFVPASYLSLIIFGGITSGIYLLFIIRIVLHADERTMVRDVLPGCIKNKIPKWLL